MNLYSVFEPFYSLTTLIFATSEEDVFVQLKEIKTKGYSDIGYFFKKNDQYFFKYNDDDSEDEITITAIEPKRGVIMVKS